MRFEYTIEAYNSDPGVGKTNAMIVIVQANAESEAVDRAKTIITRQNYAVTSIRELSREINQTQTIKPEKVELDDKAVKKLQKFKKKG